MMSRKLRFLKQFAVVGFVVLLAAFAVSANDPDPNSPTPILLSAEDSTRALAVAEGTKIGRTLPRAENNAFEYGAKVVFFVTNIRLMDGEGAKAFRFYGEDANGRHYLFPVTNIKLIDKQNRIYALSVELREVFEYWGEPADKGDMLVSVAWRGLESNRVRVGIGEIGGKIQDDAGAIPTPFSSKISNQSKEEIDEPNFVGYRWSGDRKRFLEQATFGPTPALDDRIRRIGLRTWLAEQFELPYPSASNPYPNIPLKSSDPANTTVGCGMFTNPSTEYTECIRTHYTQYPVQKWFYLEAFYGEPQLRHRVAWALSQIWVVSGVDTQQSRHMIEYHKVLSRNAFGNWRNLMYEMTMNPAMGNYLDMARSTRTNPNENYAREILQLFNVGLFMLNPNGTYQLDGQGNPIPTYTQDTVNNFTKVFTGYTFCSIAANCPNIVNGTVNYIDPMILTNTGNHDLTAKTLLTYNGSTTTNIPACTGCNAAAIQTYAANSINQALDNIYNHPNVAPFVSRLLIQNLITGDPTPDYVQRVAAVFNANRNNPSQMKEVVKAILLDPEARGDVKTDSRYGKLREPVQFLTNIARHFDVRSADRTTLSDGVVTTETASMGQTAFMSPTVFNYYPPDYIVPGTTLNSPEFGIMTTGTSIARANFGNTIVFNQININSGRGVTAGTSISLADIQALSQADTTGNLMLDELNRKLMHGTMSADMRNTIRTAILAVPSATAANHLTRARTAVYLIFTSSQYQVQK